MCVSGCAPPASTILNFLTTFSAYVILIAQSMYWICDLEFYLKGQGQRPNKKYRIQRVPKNWRGRIRGNLSLRRWCWPWLLPQRSRSTSVHRCVANESGWLRSTVTLGVIFHHKWPGDLKFCLRGQGHCQRESLQRSRAIEITSRPTDHRVVSAVNTVVILHLTLTQVTFKNC